MEKAARSIAESDILSKCIRGNNEWSLLPNFAFLGVIYPTEQVSVSAFPSIPMWFGKFSTTKKVKRELKELRMILSHSVTGNRFAVKYDYAKPLG